MDACILKITVALRCYVYKLACVTLMDPLHLHSQLSTNCYRMWCSIIFIPDCCEYIHIVNNLTTIWNRYDGAPHSEHFVQIWLWNLITHPEAPTTNAEAAMTILIK